MLKTKSELLTYITNGKMEELEFINSIPYRNSSETPLPFCDAYTFTSGYSSGYISFFISQGSKKWAIKSFHRSNTDTTILALALEKAGLFVKNLKKRGYDGQ